MNFITAEKIKKWKSYKARASKKKIEFTITEETFFFALHTQCYICGKNGNLYELGLDRIDNSFGYINGNIAPCCWDCNRAKSNLGSLDFLRWLKRLQPNHCLVTKGHSQPKGSLNGREVHVDVRINPELLKKLNTP